MIAFDFEYYRPNTIEEALYLFNLLNVSRKNPIYYAGGTEVICMARANEIIFGSVIDLKAIPECNALTIQNNQIIIGAALPLTQICESNIFPLMTAVAKQTADHTTRNKMTLGGNICGSLPYRETVLPLLICDAQAVIASNGGKKSVPLTQIFNQRLNLQKDAFLVQLIIEPSYAGLPYQNLKRTKQGKLEYPLLSMAALKKDGQIRFSFSGICSFPFRTTAIEDCLNNTMLSAQERIEHAVQNLPSPIISDIQGSADYREFIFRNALSDVLANMEEVV